MRAAPAAAALVLLPGLGGSPAAAAQDFGGLPEGEGRAVVYAVCSRCHSIRLVTQQGMTRKKWDQLLDWMVQKQGMPPLDTGTEQTVLDYLARHFDAGRPRDAAGGGGAPSPFTTVQPLGAPQ